MTIFIIEKASMVFELASVLLLVWGGLVVLSKLLYSEWHHLSDNVDRVEFERVRVEFGQRIVLAVEFLLVADLLMTILNPSFNELVNLGLIVVIRTVLSYFLTKEIDRHEKEWKR